MSEEREGKGRTEIGRDPMFFRAFADRAFSFNLGRDLDLVFLLDAPRCVSMGDSDDGTSENLQVESVTSEVARLRMPPGAGVVLALSILGDLAPTGRLKGAALKSAFDEILAILPSDDALPEDTQEQNAYASGQS